MRIQIFTDINLWPPDPFEYLHESFPRVGPSLAFAIEPLKQNLRGKMSIGRTLLQIIGYGVIVQMPLNPGFRPPKHLTFP